MFKRRNTPPTYAGTQPAKPGLPKEPALDAAVPYAGKIIGGNYRIVGLIGRGGMGSVYEAQQLSVGNRRVAVKVLDEDSAVEDDTRRRFIREAIEAGGLNHNHIVQVFHAGTEEGIGLYYVMELLQGKTIEDTIRIRGEGDRIVKTEPMHWQRVKNIAMQMCDALAAVHAKGLIHRDIKPQNIMLVKDPSPVAQNYDFVKIFDFGVAGVYSHVGRNRAKADETRQMMAIGTPRYMAPEQMQGKEKGPGFDIYATGAVIYEMLCGKPAFSEPDFMAYLRAKESVPPTPSARGPGLNIPLDIEKVAMRALSIKPEYRYQSMQEMYEALANCTGKVTAASAAEITLSAADVTSGIRRIPRPQATKPKPYSTIIIGAALAAVAAGAAYIAVKSRLKASEETPAITLPVPQPEAAEPLPTVQPLPTIAIPPETPVPVPHIILPPVPAEEAANEVPAAETQTTPEPAPAKKLVAKPAIRQRAQEVMPEPAQPEDPIDKVRVPETLKEKEPL